MLVVARQTAGPIITRPPSVTRALSTNMPFMLMEVPQPMRILDPSQRPKGGSIQKPDASCGVVPRSTAWRRTRRGGHGEAVLR
jgi:hypothetical protein